MAPVCSLAGKCKRADRKHRLVEPDEVNNSRGATFGACKLTKEAPPNLSADYLYLRQTAVVKQAIDTARTSVPSGGHSSSYLCQQDSVFAAQDRRLACSHRSVASVEQFARSVERLVLGPQK